MTVRKNTASQPSEPPGRPIRLGVYGGSFNPPHLSHLMAMVYVLSLDRVDRVVMIPCAHHPFAKKLESFENRFAMCRLAVEGILDDRVEVSAIEASRDGPSYTVDTLEELSGIYPSAKLSLIVGSDVLDEINQWKDHQRIRELATILHVPRLTFNGNDDTAPSQNDSVEGERIYALPAIESADIRRKILRGVFPEAAMPKAVADYIREKELYGFGAEPCR